MLSLKYLTCFIKDDLSEGWCQSQNDTGMYDALASMVSCRHQIPASVPICVINTLRGIGVSCTVTGHEAGNSRDCSPFELLEDRQSEVRED